MTSVIERGQVDGVPALRSASISGRHAAALTFRVGRFDEPLAASGITHMVEHLAFAGRPTASYPFNASVDGRYTTFYMESDNHADIADFVGAVCRGLTADASGVLDRERVVLRTEAASRGGAGALGAVLAERYGATGPGIVSYQEFGLRHLGWAAVADWRSHQFTRANAVLAIAGDVPRGLRVLLPDGTRARPADPVPRRLALPGFVTTARGGIGVSLVRQRTSVEEYAAVQILRERLTRVLRHELGITYDVHHAAEELGPELGHSWLAADALAEQIPLASHAALTEFEALIDGGCGAAELDELVRRLRSAHQGPGASWAILQRAARDLLNGRRSRDPEESVRLIAGLEPKHVAAAARALHEQMIVTVPWPVPAVQGRMPALPGWSAAAVSGTVLASADSDATLTVGPDGVTLTVEPGRHDPARQTTVRYGELAALVRWKDGRQVLVGADGFSVQLDPDEWPQGDRVVADVAARSGAGQLVTIDAEGSPRPGRGRKAAGTAAGAGRPGGAAPASSAAAGTARRTRFTRQATYWGSRTAGIAIILVGLALGGRAVTFCAVLGFTVTALSFAYGYRQSRSRSGPGGPR